MPSSKDNDDHSISNNTSNSSSNSSSNNDSNNDSSNASSNTSNNNNHGSPSEGGFSQRGQLGPMQGYRSGSQVPRRG